MLELRERNGEKHIVSDDELLAFSWAGYYAQYSNIFINGKEYRVVNVMDSYIDLSNGISLPVGCYSIFENEDETRIYDSYKLRDVRKRNPLESHNYYFNDEDFFKITQ